MKPATFINFFSLFFILFASGIPVFAAGKKSTANACRVPIFESEFPDQLLNLIKQDLLDLQNVSGEKASPRHKALFNSDFINGEAYCAFLKARISGIHYGGKSTTALAQNSYTKWGYVKIFNGYSQYPKHIRWEVLMHEASHTNVGWGKGYADHHRCPSPYHDENGHEMKTTRGHLVTANKNCDSVIDSAYALTYTFIMNLGLFCDNCSSEMKEEMMVDSWDVLVRLDKTSTRKALQADFQLNVD